MIEPTKEDAWGWVHELTKALTGLTVGGSEFFVRRGERYIADIPACVAHVRERDKRNHRLIVYATLRAKSAEAERDAARAALHEIALLKMNKEAARKIARILERTLTAAAA